MADDPKKLIEAIIAAQEARGKSILQRKEELKLEREISKEMERRGSFGFGEQLKTEIELERESLNLIIARREALKQNHFQNLKNIELLEEKVALGQTLSKMEAKSLKEAKKQVDKTEIRIAKREEEIKQQRKITEELLKQQEAQDNLVASTDNFLGLTLGLSDSWKKTTVGAFAHNTAVNGMGSSFSAIGESLKKNFTISNIAGSSLMKMQEMTLKWAHEQDNANSSFVASTGVQKKYQTTIADTFFEYRSLGVDSEKASQTLSALHGNLSQFGSLAEHQKKRLAGLGATMNAVGISSESFSEAVLILNKTFNMSAPAAGELVKQFSELGGAGKPPAEVIADFVANADVWARHTGPTMNKVFTNLIEKSAKLGIKMSNLVGIAKQFDTFEGAASSVSRLNALMGGDYLNTMDLMNATEDERVEMLQRVMLQSGKSWEAMDRFERMAIASAAGINDLSEAGRLFGESSNIDTERERMEDLEKAAKKAQTVMQKLQLAFYTFVVRAEPVIDWIKDALDAFMKFDDQVRETFKYFGAGGIFGLIFGGIALVKWVVPFFSTVTAMAGKFASSISAFASKAAAGSGGGAPGAGDPGKMAAQAKSIAALGVAFLGLGIGIGAAAYGISFLASSLKDLNSEQLSALKEILIGFMATIYIFTAGIIIMALVGVKAAPPILALGVAMLLLGAGVALAGYGMSLLATSLMNLDAAQLSALKDILLGFIPVIYVFLAAVVVLALVGASAAGPILALGAAMLMLGIGVAIAASGLSVLVSSFEAISPEKMALMKDMVAEVGLTVMGLATALLLLANPAGLLALASVATGLTAIAISVALIDLEKLKLLESSLQSISNIDLDKTANIKTTMDHVVNSVNSVEKEKSETITKAGRNFKPVTFYESKKLNSSIAEKASEASQKPTSATSKASEGQKLRNLEITIPFIIDGREMKKYILDVVNDEVKIRKNN